jgi:hypothetical protein
MVRFESAKSVAVSLIVKYGRGAFIAAPAIRELSETRPYYSMCRQMAT